MKKYIILFSIGCLTSTILEATRNQMVFHRRPPLHRHTSDSDLQKSKEQKRDEQRQKEKEKAIEQAKHQAATVADLKRAAALLQKEERTRAGKRRESSIL